MRRAPRNVHLAAIAAIAAAIVVLLFPRLSAAQSGGRLAKMKAAGVLLWGADLQGGEPFVSEDPHDPQKLVGFEVDIAGALARELGVRAELVQNDWSTLVPSLERGSFDVAMNGLEVTPARAARILFTRPYYVFAERLMVRRGDTRFAPTLASLAGARVGTLANSYAYDLLRGVTEPVLYEGVQEPYLDLAGGRTDAVLLDDLIATRYGEPNAALATVGDVAEGTYAIGVARGETDLFAAVDAALGRIAAQGTLEAILRRHGLWSDREKRLLAPSSATPVAAPSGEAAALTPHHVALFVRAAGVTLLVSTLAMTLAAPLGLALALARRDGNRVTSALAGAYVELYRGTPMLLQLYVLYYGLAPLVRVDALSAAVVGLGMNYAAYEAEAYRAGLQAVPVGQMEAALSLGMSRRLALRRVILPQALRHALPNVTSDFIALLKDSSLVSVITVVELTKQMAITAVDVRSWLAPGLLCAALYLAMSLPLARLTRRLEARLARG